ncbi:flagellar basal body-associated FliL family protein [Ferrimonas marina]|uniref:Flagellar protein FliL n=1 Tax=Ferrimonas marina TaxID=299255 RepID=A0A1M5YEZ0_9GAMM|nr:flagellar basal body-associated FliL family protein [Ferrimonas marina]SHI10469.1 flagellar FliL protein [Ferrimonas marina]
MAEQTLELQRRDKPAPRWRRFALFGAAAVALVALVFALVLMLTRDSDSPSAEVEAVAESPTGITAAVNGAQYVSLPRPFLFNLPGDDRSYMVQIKVQFQVRSPESQQAVRKHIPLLEDALLTTFSAAKPELLRRKEGKDELRRRALANVQTTMQSITGQPSVDRVLFTGFVMQ